VRTTYIGKLKINLPIDLPIHIKSILFYFKNVIAINQIQLLVKFNNHVI